MAIKDLVKTNGETRNLPVRSEGSYPWPSMYRDMTEWMSRWDRWFDNFFARAFDLTPLRNASTWGTEWLPQLPTEQGGIWPAVNVVERDNEYHVTAELPGLSEDDIDLSISNGALVIRGEKRQEQENTGKGYYRMERSYGAFHRSIPLPEEVAADKIEASFKNGVLNVTLPRLPEARSNTKRIPIKSESSK